MSQLKRENGKRRRPGRIRHELLKILTIGFWVDDTASNVRIVALMRQKHQAFHTNDRIRTGIVPAGDKTIVIPLPNGSKIITQVFNRLSRQSPSVPHKNRWA